MMNFRLKFTKRVVRTLLLILWLFLVLFAVVFIPDAWAKWSYQQINSVEDFGYVITGIELKQCSIFNLPGCRKGGDWFLIDKDLNFDSNGKKLYHGLWKQKLFIQKKKIQHLTANDVVINDIKITDPVLKYKTEEYDPRTPAKYFYNLDVLFGLDAIDPRPHWELTKHTIIPIKSEIQAYFTFKRDQFPSRLPAVDLDIDKNKKNYKILQIADLHFSTHEGICRDQFPEVEDCKADKRTSEFLNKVLDIEKPDLAILTGDQIFGEDSFDSITTMLKVVAPLIERKIPYALMFGNHDDEGSLSREELMRFFQTLPYNLATQGPVDIDGVGNYFFQVKNKESQQSLLSFFILDTHKYSPNPKILPGYDWLKESQLSHVKDLHTTNTFGPNDIKFAFFHVPLPEFRNTNDNLLIGNYKEPITAPKYNSLGRDVLQELGVSVVSVGHDHCNDYCLLDTKEGDESNKLWLCYGGAAGEGGYGGYGGTTRRLRIFEAELDSKTVKSYKRLETSPDEKFDEQVLVTDGKVN